MSDPTTPPSEVEEPGSRLSAVWLLPLIALAIAGYIVLDHYRERGPVITVSLKNASGLKAGQTPLRFRDVDIGKVEEIGFDPEFNRIEAMVRVSREAAARMGSDTQFWVVQPEVTASGVRGLETLFSGSYLATDLTEAGDGARPAIYEALEQQPLTAPGAPGARVTLAGAGSASLSPGAPIYFKGLEVGQIESRRLAPDSGQLEYDAFVHAPYDEWLKPGARFWDASGFDLSLGADGVRFSMAAVSTLLRGGVAFDIVSPGEGDGPESRYTLYATEKAARDSHYSDDPLNMLRLQASFTGTVRGLSVGAPVEYAGVRVGEVEEIAVRLGESAAETRIATTLRLELSRLGLQHVDTSETLSYLARSVDSGLRARLASGNIVTGSLYVELVELSDSPAATIDLDAEPWPVMPTAPSQLDELQNAAEDLLQRAANLPIESLFAEAVGMLRNIRQITAEPEMAEAPRALTGALNAVRDAVVALNAQELGPKLSSTLSSADDAARAVAAAAENLPEIARRLEAAAAAAQTTIAAYGPGSAIANEAVAALREIREAARAVDSLSRALERRPNSIILGR